MNKKTLASLIISVLMVGVISHLMTNSAFAVTYDTKDKNSAPPSAKDAIEKARVAAKEELDKKRTSKTDSEKAKALRDEAKAYNEKAIAEAKAAKEKAKASAKSTK